MHRKDKPQIRMHPTQESLDAGYPSCLQADSGLIMQHEFMPLQGAAKASFDGLPRNSPDIHVVFEELVVVAALSLGFIHGGVGGSNQALGIQAVIRVRAQADACRDVQRVLIRDVGRG